MEIQTKEKQIRNLQAKISAASGELYLMKRANDDVFYSSDEVAELVREINQAISDLKRLRSSE